MVDINYEKMVERIAKSSGLGVDEIRRKIEAKRAKLSGLISLEGAAQVIAAELGINFENEKFKIDELMPGMRKVNIVGKIIRLFPIREFTTKKGDISKVCNFILADDTSNIKTVLWDTHHIALIENGTLKEGSVVEIQNGSMRDNEIHLGSFSEFKPSLEIISDVIEERSVKEKPIFEFKPNESVKTRAFIVSSFEPKFFYVCSQCKKKAETLDNVKYECKEHGSVIPEKKALINITLDDGTGTIKAVVFSDNLKNLGFSDLENNDLIIRQRENLLGKEMNFSGNVRINSYFNSPELIVDSLEIINLDSLIKILEQ